MKKYSINTPSVYITCDKPHENMPSEVSDELLYGFEVKTNDDIINKKIAYITTDYGYSGYIRTTALSDINFFDKAIVKAKNADLLITPEYKYSPVMTLCTGSIVTITGEKENFYAVNMNDGTICYIRKESVIKEYYDYTPDRIVKLAQEYIGVPYRWGGKSSLGIDCSGLCFMVYRLCGITIARDSTADETLSDIIEKDKIQIGDILHFEGHVAIYMGNGEFIHANSRDGCVAIGSFGSRPDLILKYASRPKIK